MNVYIMRHGETEWNSLKKIQGSTDIPLNEKGIQLARVTAQAMHNQGIVFDRVFSSPLQRAVATAKIMCRADTTIPMITDERLTEFKFGKAEGRTLEELTTNPQFKTLGYLFSNPPLYKAENGAESFAEVFARTKDFLEHQIKPLEGQCKSVLISCHGGICRALLMNINGWSLDRYWDIPVPNCAVNLVTVQNGQFSIVSIGKTYYEVDRKGIL
ncbi:MAG: histidine phosphatase family protein [Treponema sp.]|nr:histidine phosphatase family protein [Treponema sp.]